MRKNLFFLLFAIYYLPYAILSGCATAPYAPALKPQPGVPGVYHRVERGQTLWRISKMYDIDLEEIVRANRIPDVASIETGQLILIPHRLEKKVSFVAGDDFIWPIKGRVISGFGTTAQGEINRGLNIKPGQNTEVSAARQGKVVFYAEKFSGYGKTILIDHGNGFTTVYARLNQVFVQLGQVVPQGARIGKINPGGNYLHFEIRKGNIAQNPYFYLSR